MVVVEERDPPARAHRGHHLLHHREGILDVLEQEPGVGEVEAPPLRGGQGKALGGSRPQLDEPGLARRRGLSLRLRDLPWVAFDTQHTSRGSRRSRQDPAHLAEPGAHVEDPFCPREVEHPQLRLVHEPLHQGQPLLLLRRVAVDVVPHATR